VLEILTIVTSIAGIFTLMDLFIEKQAKAKISEYVFGFGTADLSKFEHNVIQALLSHLRVDGRISFKRVLFRYSMVIALLISVLSFLGEFIAPYFIPDYEPDDVWKNLLESVIAIPILTIFFWPFDCWSLWVTNRIFGKHESRSFVHFLGRVLLDVFLTLLPLCILILIISFISIEGSISKESLTFTVLISFLVIVLANAFGSLIITAIQLLTLAVGMTLRFLMRLTRLNQGLAMVSRAHEFPFTFIGLICGVSAAAITPLLA